MPKRPPLPRPMATPARAAAPQDGARQVAAILNALPPDQASAALEDIQARDPALAEAVRALLFTFEDFLDLDLRSLREILREAEGRDLLPALKAATPELRDKLLSALSVRAAAQLRDDLASLPPVRLSEALEAQQRLCALARRLEGEGRVVLKGTGEAYV